MATDWVTDGGGPITRIQHFEMSGGRERAMKFDFRFSAQFLGKRDRYIMSEIPHPHLLYTRTAERTKLYSQLTLLTFSGENFFTFILKKESRN